MVPLPKPLITTHCSLCPLAKPISPSSYYSHHLSQPTLCWCWFHDLHLQGIHVKCINWWHDTWYMTYGTCTGTFACMFQPLRKWKTVSYFQLAQACTQFILNQVFVVIQQIYSWDTENKPSWSCLCIPLKFWLHLNHSSCG